MEYKYAYVKIRSLKHLAEKIDCKIGAWTETRIALTEIEVKTILCYMWVIYRMCMLLFENIEITYIYHVQQAGDYGSIQLCNARNIIKISKEIFHEM